MLGVTFNVADTGRTLLFCSAEQAQLVTASNKTRECRDMACHINAPSAVRDLARCQRFRELRRLVRSRIPSRLQPQVHLSVSQASPVRTRSRQTRYEEAGFYSSSAHVPI